MNNNNKHKWDEPESILRMKSELLLTELNQKDTTIKIKKELIKRLEKDIEINLKIDIGQSIIWVNHVRGIYKIVNDVNQQCYIGSAENFYKRINKHIYMLKKCVHHSNYLQNAFNMYGFENFTFYIVEIVSHDVDIIQREQIYLNAICEANLENGNFSERSYNICKIAGSPRGRVASEETKKKIGLYHKGKIVSEETKQKIKANTPSQKGIPKNTRHKHSEEAKLKISIANKGKKMSPESIEKTRQKNIGKKRSEETKRKISEAQKGRVSNRKGVKLSQETINKMLKTRANNGGFAISEETKKKLSVAHMGKNTWSKGENHPHYGKQRSEETKKKISEKNSGGANWKAIKISQLDLQNNLIKEWNSIIEAHKSLSNSKSTSKISDCLKGKIETAFGYKWKYKEIKNIQK
jgi:group I intron endonuclease